jgi:UDP-N-acetylmuramoyl-tripeptide--D-alanyl-D-alanine ligase
VENCLKALQELANFHRKQFNIPILGITGSNGKTTTKELTAHLLAQKYTILCTKGNLNNHIGVPLTLLNITHQHEIAIIEMGANHLGDIKELCEIAEPTYGIITNIGKAHLLGFKTIEGVIETKTALYKSVCANKGLLFANNDDEILLKNLPVQSNVLLYSGKQNHQAKVTGELIRLTPFIQLKWTSKNYTSPEVKTEIIGEYNFYNLLAAITIADFFEVSPELINKGIETYRNENNRSQLKQTNHNDLILDAYNANPSSMSSAISSFKKIDRVNKLMILGDMFELGVESSSEHLKIIQLAEESGISTFFIGNYFFEHKKNKSNFFASKEDFKKHLETFQIVNHFILLKGSRGIALEELIVNL